MLLEVSDRPIHPNPKRQRGNDLATSRRFGLGSVAAAIMYILKKP